MSEWLDRKRRIISLERHNRKLLNEEEEEIYLRGRSEGLVMGLLGGMLFTAFMVWFGEVCRLARLAM